MEKLSTYTGASPATSVFKAILNALISPVFHFNSFFLPPPKFLKTIKFCNKPHFRNCISLPKHKKLWLLLQLLSECEMTVVKGSGEDCKWLSNTSKCVTAL